MLLAVHIVVDMLKRMVEEAGNNDTFAQIVSTRLFDSDTDL